MINLIPQQTKIIKGLLHEDKPIHIVEQGRGQGATVLIGMLPLILEQDLLLITSTPVEDMKTIKYFLEDNKDIKFTWSYTQPTITYANGKKLIMINADKNVYNKTMGYMTTLTVIDRFNNDEDTTRIMMRNLSMGNKTLVFNNDVLDSRHRTPMQHNLTGEHLLDRQGGFIVLEQSWDGWLVDWDKVVTESRFKFTASPKHYKDCVKYY
jgi:uncharacterized protein YlzI (FlbEa/FlbD family)